MDDDGLKIIGARIFYRGGTFVFLTFNNGRHKLVDLLPIIKNSPSHQSLIDPKFEKLANFTTTKDALTWEDGTISLAVETLWEQPDVRSTQYVWMR